MAKLGAGMTFGERSLILDQRAATCTATTRTRCLVLDRDTFTEFASQATDVRWHDDDEALGLVVYEFARYAEPPAIAPEELAIINATQWIGLPMDESPDIVAEDICVQARDMHLHACMFQPRSRPSYTISKIMAYIASKFRCSAVSVCQTTPQSQQASWKLPQNAAHHSGLCGREEKRAEPADGRRQQGIGLGRCERVVSPFHSRSLGDCSGEGCGICCCGCGAHGPCHQPKSPGLPIRRTTPSLNTVGKAGTSPEAANCHLHSHDTWRGRTGHAGPDDVRSGDSQHPQLDSHSLKSPHHAAWYRKSVRGAGHARLRCAGAEKIASDSSVRRVRSFFTARAPVGKYEFLAKRHRDKGKRPFAVAAPRRAFPAICNWALQPHELDRDLAHSHAGMGLGFLDCINRSHAQRLTPCHSCHHFARIKGATQDVNVVLRWAGYTLYNFQGCLRTGQSSLSLWPGACPNPTVPGLINTEQDPGETAQLILQPSFGRDESTTTRTSVISLGSRRNEDIAAGKRDLGHLDGHRRRDSVPFSGVVERERPISCRLAPGLRRRLNELLEKDPLRYTVHEKAMIWTHRRCR